jgi:adenylate cyclase
MGDGVNIAARLEGIADPGGISISEDVWRQVQGKVATNFVDAGEQSLKNIQRRVHVYRVKLDAERAAASAPSALQLPEKPSIAVLPFQNMSGDSEQDYFCDGVVEDITTGLARIKWLFVIGRNSSFAYKRKTPAIRQIERAIDIRYIVESRVSEMVNCVRINKPIIKHTDDSTLRT